MLSLIAAMDRNRAIGKDNAMPWHLPADLKHFRAVTWGKPIIMGRKTYDSLGRPLPGRTNIVLTRDPAFRPDGVEVAHSVREALQAAADAPEAVVIGGASVYARLLPEVERMYLTYIDAEFRGDTYFPPFNGEQWQELEREPHKADGDNLYDYTFVVLQRREEP